MTNPIRILIVEDSEDDTALVLREFRRHGFAPAIRRVESREDMVDALDTGIWDVVIADHSLPGFDSLAALDLLRQRHLDVPFIIFSGSIGEEMAVAAMRAGARDYVTKSGFRRLVPTVQREIEEYARRRDAERQAQRRRSEAEALAQIARETAENLELPTLTKRIALRALALFGAVSASVRLRADDGRLVAVALAGTAESVIDVGHALAPGAGVGGRAVAENRTIATADVLADPALLITPELRAEHGPLGHRAVAAAPLRAGNEVLGVLAIGDREARAYTAHELAFLEALADQAALAVRNGQLLARERAARTEAESLNRAKDELLAMLSHELRNPLAAITTAVAVLDRMGGVADHGTRFRDIIRRQTHQLTRMVDDLLDVARMTTGKVALDIRPIDLGATVRTAAESFVGTRPFDRRAVEITAEPVWVPGDRARIEQIFVNLLANAVGYTAADGRIHVRVHAHGGHAVLEVEDDGAGIEAGLLPHIFDLFTQGDRGLARTAGGLGVGLTLVRRLAEQHGGTVEARSAGAGHGSTFAVRLPRIPAPESPEAHGATPARTARRTVLLVVDDGADRDTLRAVLTMSGHEVHVTADPVTAAARVIGIHPDVAFVDADRPGLDAHAFAARLRAVAPGLAVVALTGATPHAGGGWTHETGFRACLVKPVSPDDLDRVLAALP